MSKAKILTGIARAAIAEKLGLEFRSPDAGAAPWLRKPGASFVTLHKSGQLRGCIGSILAHRSLYEDIRANAVAAAFQDPRFPPLEAGEFPQIDIEVSVLSPPKPLAVRDEAELLRVLRPGVDGLILEYGRHRATFLPQVWQQLPQPQRFLAHLKQKAGLEADFWHPDMLFYTYQVERYSEIEDS